MDAHDLTMAMLASLNDLVDTEQIAFVHRLVDATALVRRRAAASPIVVEGALVHDHDARLQLSPGEG